MVHALVVDDDLDILESVKSLAAEAGYSIVVAPNWDEGLSQFTLLFPDLVIADYNLPGSNHGLRLLFEACSLRPSTRLVLMSAYLNADDVEKVSSLGLVDRAFRKTDPVTTGRLVMEELQAAAERSKNPVDWPAVAKATLSGQLVRVEDIDRLDEYFKDRRRDIGGGSEK